jgi:hypothetical protein
MREITGSIIAYNEQCSINISFGPFKPRSPERKRVQPKIFKTVRCKTSTTGLACITGVICHQHAISIRNALIEHDRKKKSAP